MSQSQSQTSSSETPPYRAKRRWLFLPFAIFGLLALAYTALWFKGSSEAIKALDRWVAGEKAAGFDAGYDKAQTVGYPLRFAVEIEGLRRGNPARGTSWKASRLRINALPYDLSHIIVESLGPQTAIFSDKRIWTLNTKTAVASLHWNKQGGLVRAAADVKDFTWTANDGAAGNMKAFALQAAPKANDASIIQFESEAVDGHVPFVPEELAGFGQDFASLKVKGGITQAQAFDAGLSRAAMDLWSAGNGAMQFDDASAKWGAVELNGKGQLVLDRLRRPSGEINFFAKDVDRVAQSLIDSGWIKGPASQLFLKAARQQQAADGGLNMPLQALDGELLFFGVRVMTLKPLYSPTVPDASGAPVAGG